MNAPQLPPHPGNRHQLNLELAYDGPIPADALEAARQLDADEAAAWQKRVNAMLGAMREAA
jgi:FtsZ-binding cell division protein ZapB